VRLYWLPDDPVTLMNEVRLPDFQLINWMTSEKRVSYPNGRWDELEVEFRFQRQYGFFILQVCVCVRVCVHVCACVRRTFQP
jgi:hypothetical protein